MASQTDVAVQAECAPLLAASGGSPAGNLKSSSSIARQGSIYSLTLDEFQNVLGDPGKSFGSMNMDEFLKNIWTVEESQAMAAAMGTGLPSEELNHGIQRQASVSLPRTLSRKTVDDVLKDLTRGSLEMDSNITSSDSSSHERQVTLGEMTLEDFLVKAGVVKTDDSGSAPLIPFGMNFDNLLGEMPASSKSKAGERFGELIAPFGMKGAEGEKPVVTLSLSAGANRPVSHVGHEARLIEPVNHASPAIHPPEWLSSNGFKTEISFSHPPVNNTLHQHALEAGARKGGMNGGLIGGRGVLGPDLGATSGGTSPASLVPKTGSPQSPLLDGIVPSYDSMMLHSPVPYAVDGMIRGRKREFGGSLEKVVERRQKRMIKNRESAARSRARKQAYTVELEEEVSHLKEENMRLRQHEEEMAERRRRQLIDVLTSFAPKFTPKPCRLRRTHTMSW